MYRGLSVKLNTRETPQEDHGSILFVFVSTCVVGKNPNTLNLSHMTDDTITRCSIQGLGSPLYICGISTRWRVSALLLRIEC